MKVVFYLGSGDNKLGGALTYALEILQTLINLTDINKIFVVVAKSAECLNNTQIISSNKVKVIEDKRYRSFIKLIRFKAANVLIDIYELFQSYGIKKNILLTIAKFIDPYRRFFDSLNADLIHIPFQISPTYFTRTPLLITMHDLQEFHYPEYFSPSQRIYRAIKYKHAIENANHIVVSFDHIKNDIIKYFNASENRISIFPIYFWGNNILHTKAASLEFLKLKYNLPKKYLFYPAQTWPHKNHLNLIKAIKLLKDRNVNIDLVCTGNQTKFFNTILEEIENNNLSKSIKFLGNVCLNELKGLYENAFLIIIPTKYEAGSGPLFESIKLEKPVICSNITSLPQTISNNKFLFNPDDIKSIATLIENSVTNEKFLNDNIKNSIIRKKLFEKEINNQNHMLEIYSKARN